jgi:hypothetical protein
MRPPAWLDRLQCLAQRLPGLGVGPDLFALSTAELWALYRFLSRMAAQS